MTEVMARLMVSLEMHACLISSKASADLMATLAFDLLRIDARYARFTIINAQNNTAKKDNQHPSHV